MELPSKQDGKEKEALSYESYDDQSQSEDSDGGSFFTNAVDIGQTAGFLPDLTSSGIDCDTAYLVELVKPLLMAPQVQRMQI